MQKPKIIVDTSSWIKAKEVLKDAGNKVER